MPFSNEKRCVLVAGGLGGIGGGIVARLEREGFSVLVLDKKASPSPNCFQVDFEEFVLKRELKGQVALEIRQFLATQALAGIVNCAAQQTVKEAKDLTSDELTKDFSINVAAPFELVQLLMPELMHGRGTVINIGSIHSNLSKPHFLSYAVSKAALRRLTSSMALEFGDKVQFCIEPAAVLTAMLIEGFDGSQQRIKELSVSPNEGVGNDRRGL